MSGPENETPTKQPSSEEPAAQRSSTASTSQATAAVSSAVGVVRERLVAGEQIVLVAAAVIVLTYLIFDFLLDYTIFIGGFVPVLATMTVLAIWVHRWGHYDFGTGYRILIGGLGVALALFALTSLLAWLRIGGNSVDFLHLLGRILYWASGVAALIGGWQVFRTREG